MAKFIEESDTDKPTNRNRIINFLNSHYNDSVPDPDGCNRFYRERHITDVNMMGDIVDESNYTILMRHHYDGETSISSTIHLWCVERDIEKYLLMSDGWGVVHVFRNGEEIKFTVKVELIT
jgi:hypothetical protein